MHSNSSVVCSASTSAAVRATFMARAPVDGLPTGHYTATDALGDYEGGFVPRERSSGRGPSQPSENDDTCLVGLRRSLASHWSAD